VVQRTDNAVLFWNGVLLDAANADSKKPVNQQEQGGPTRVSRVAAIVHAAVHNAVNGVRQRVTFYQDPMSGQPPSPGPAPAGASAEAAGAGAAYRALVTLYPSQKAAFDQALNNFKALPLPGAGHQPSYAYGEGVTQQLLAARTNDGSAPPGPYVPPPPGPGVWTPDANLAPPGPPLTPHWGQVRLFLLDSISRVRPPRFPALTDGDYTFAFRNVRDKGRAKPPLLPQVNPPQGRTTDEENIALFWSYDDLLGTPIRLYNQHAFEILGQEPNVPPVASIIHRHARLFALINIAMADAGIACWEAKFRPPLGYHVWRPFQGIRAAGIDGNADTDPVANWLPLGRPRATGPQGNKNTTPNFPAYISGHSSFGAAMFGTLGKFFGDKGFPFTLSSEEVPNRRSFVDRIDPETGEVVRSYAQAANENSESRIFLGVHWRRDHTRGRPLGQQVADYIWPDFLRPTT
jgi:hypothetical protein